MAIPQLFDDPRPIQKIWTSGAQYAVGWQGITQIKCYWEQNDTIWFAVYAGERLVRRINGAHVESISYGEDDPDALQT